MTANELIAELQKMPSDVQLRWFINGFQHIRRDMDKEYLLDFWMIAGHGYEIDVWLDQLAKNPYGEHETFRQLPDPTPPKENP